MAKEFGQLGEEKVAKSRILLILRNSGIALRMPESWEGSKAICFRTVTHRNWEKLCPELVAYVWSEYLEIHELDVAPCDIEGMLNAIAFEASYLAEAWAERFVKLNAFQADG